MISVLPSTTHRRLKLHANRRRVGPAWCYDKQLILPDLDRGPGDPAQPDGDVALRVGEPEQASAHAAADGGLDDAELRRAVRAAAAVRGSTAWDVAVASGRAAVAAAAVAAHPPLLTPPRPFLYAVASSQAPAPCSSPGSSSFGTAVPYGFFLLQNPHTAPGV